MGPPHRQSGFTNFTLERPAAFVRRAQVVIVQRTEPWFTQAEVRLLRAVSSTERACSASADHVRSALMRAQATLRESVFPAIKRAQAAGVGAITQRAQQTRAAVAKTVGPRFDAMQVSAAQATLRGLMWAEETRVHTVAPRLTRMQQITAENTIHALMWAQTTFDHRILPWATQTRVDLRERYQSSDDVIAALKARLEAGVPLWLTALLVVVVALIAQAVAHKNVDHRNDVTSRQLAQVFKAEQTTVETRARAALDRESDELHRLFGSVMVLSMHNALMRKSYDELDQYLREIGKSERVKLAVLADLEGRVVAATDQKLKGTDFARHFPPALLNEAVMAIQPAEGGLKWLIMPIERYSVRLGTAVLVYTPPSMGTN
jgi:hypothetical protein